MQYSIMRMVKVKLMRGYISGSQGVSEKLYCTTQEHYLEKYLQDSDAKHTNTLQ